MNLNRGHAHAAVVIFAVLLLALTWLPETNAAGTVTDCANYGTTSTVGSLAWALEGGGTVTFTCSGTIIVPEIVITLGTTIDATGQTVALSGNHTNRVFYIIGGGLQLVSLTVMDGNWEGIFLSDGNGHIALINSTVSGNSGDGISVRAGEICPSYCVPSHFTVTLMNSTVSGNFGNGLSIASTALDSSGASVTLTNSTVSGNSGDGVFVLPGPTGPTGPSGPICTPNCPSPLPPPTLSNSVVAGNTGPDCSGAFVSLGYNLIGNTSGCIFTPAPGDLLNVDPLLGPLQDNGGPTFTHALLPGSPAIDAGGPTCPVTDQRGVPRPQGAACDIGAYEFVPPDTVDIVQANFARGISVLLVCALSSAYPDAALFVTVPDCLTDAPMEWNGSCYAFQGRVKSCGDLVGQTATVTSSHGGEDSSPILRWRALPAP